MEGSKYSYVNSSKLCLYMSYSTGFVESDSHIAWFVWVLTTYRFQYHTPKWSSSAINTKHTVLSALFRILDTLGLVGPVVIQPKIFIQAWWRLQRGWNEYPPMNLQEQWQEYRRNLRVIEGLTPLGGLQSNNVDVITWILSRFRKRVLYLQYISQYPVVNQ